MAMALGCLARAPLTARLKEAIDGNDAAALRISIMEHWKPGYALSLGVDGLASALGVLAPMRELSRHRSAYKKSGECLNWVILRYHCGARGCLHLGQFQTILGGARSGDGYPSLHPYSLVETICSSASVTPENAQKR